MILEQINVHDSTVSFGADCFAEALKATPIDQYSACFIISQQVVWDLHGKRIVETLGLRDAHCYLIPDGEEHKNLDTYGKLLRWLADHRADRKSVILVIGGGVVGDLSGFVAATYMRGMDWLYIPTTLLAQQDASVGGKTGANLPQGKNLVGAFWHPRAVIIDSTVLSTLPTRQLNAGYMEWLKHGMLHGPQLYRAIGDVLPDATDWTARLPLLAEGLKVKVGVVQRDPLEKGERRLLNLGHTLGHALENHLGYGALLHGEAVGIGLLYAAALAEILGGQAWEGLEDAVLPRLPRLDPASWDGDRLLDLTLLDKKGVKGVVSWIIPYAPGRVEIQAGVDRAVLEQAYQRLMRMLR